MTKKGKIKYLILSGILAMIFLLTGIASGEKQSGEEELVWWKYDRGLEEAQNLQRMILIYFYTDWCDYCRLMEETTFQNPVVKKILKESFVTIRVNAEGKTKVMMGGKSVREAEVARRYRARPYPYIWFLEPDGTPIDSLPGYLPAEDFIMVLEYIRYSHLY